MTFTEFYRQKRPYDPFPWMCRLAERFAAHDFPDVIDLPTGSAKTEIVAVWAWARQHARGMPRRLWIASDRRVIADQTYDVARQVVGEDALVSRLRGGIVLDDEPILDPARPQVISSTVDQLGSRLLFRAYGSSRGSWPIWAGLAGNDSLIVLDEAHLSPTAEDTMRACAAMGADIRIIAMTATPRHAGLKVFRLDEDDRRHPQLRRRLEAKRLVELRKGGSLPTAAQELLDAGLRRVAVICNTVAQARHVFSAIQHADKHLLIGRQRPLDRERIMTGLLPRVRSGAEASDPLVVVSTQCVEAGADFDFDGMVSAICPIDALRQRLGRLDRLGNAGESRCILIAPDGLDDVAPYGTAPRETWLWLSKHAKRRVIDLGAAGWSTIAEFVPDDALSSRPAPVSFLEPHLRMLARTSPRPRVEPDVDLLLHGPGRAPGDVCLVWRRDVDIESPAAASEILRILPPASPESCQVPVWAFRAWMKGEPPAHADPADIEGAVEAGAQTRRENAPSAPHRVLRWDGTEDGASLVSVDRIKPGDVVVLPANLGGYDAFGWAPDAQEPVADLAEEAFFQRTRRRVQRFDDPEADVEGDRVHRWSRGVVVESFTDQPRSRAVPREIRLDRHQQAVAARARLYATELGLDADEIHLAALHHDDGKANQGWQLQFNGGDPTRLDEPPLGKGRFARSPLSSLPTGWRHEAESLDRLPAAASPLVRWLVATHHGHARPFWPIADHGIGLAELMDQLQSDLGYWRLALHEAVLRCADRAVSREEMNDA
ncbi:MAG TPA: type I-U CRISPR-associated helicase/endonuclease Cas3 [Geminicoccaceae bacterium]|nr:type I-U CRISPR-associated helicase/endonuclease Cas3 [Geminicoccus sp.]HMU50311.1 type I-U CRISPR-associated helicase/endonuclease Cas3 [Geminicoccaceae bacterium]